MPKTHSVYVVELKKRSVIRSKAFAKQHPEIKDIQKGKRGFYVGMTGLTPKERFDNHKKGHKSCRFVKKHGKYLRHKLFQKYNPMTQAKAKRMEVKLAEMLRKKGHVVHQK